LPFFVWHKTWNFYSNHLNHSIIYCHNIHWHYGMSYNTGKSHALHQWCEAYTIVQCSWEVPQYYCVKSTDFRSITSPPGTANSNKHIDNDQRFKLILYIYLGTNRKRNWSSLLLPTVMKNLTEVRFSSNPWKAEQQLL